MKKLVYDLPTRLFHWLFAFLFLFAFIIGKTVDDESPNYVYHMMAGLGIAFIVLLRMIWGLVGSHHARFANFNMNPKNLVQYFKDILSGKLTKYSGHNPASSWAAILMFILALGLGTTGFLMTSSEMGKEAYEDIHELCANTFILVVMAHIAGIILHTLRHKELISLSMILGTKDHVKEEDSIQKSYRFVAVIFVVLYMAFSMNIAKSFNPQTGQLQFFGKTLQLSENEDSESNENTEKNYDKEKVDNDDVESEADGEEAHETNKKTLEKTAIDRSKTELNNQSQQSENKD